MAAAGKTKPKKDLEALRELELDVVSIPVDRIDPDPDNPNEMAPELYEALGEEIDRGFVQPIYVLRQGDRFLMIDGEHRWRKVVEKGYSTIPAVIDESGDREEARLRLVAMNRLRGQFIPVRLAHVLVDLEKRFGADELKRRLGMREDELRDSLKLAQFPLDDVRERVQAGIERERAGAPVPLNVVLSAADYKAVDRVLGKVAEGDGRGDRGKALARVCREWERAQKA